MAKGAFMDWIRAIDRKLKKKKTSLVFEVFKALVYLIIVLFVLNLFARDKIKITDKEVISDTIKENYS